jgi:hypothetical protein
MAVTAIPLSDGKFEIEGLPDIVFDKCSAIVEKPVFGDPYFNPNTGKNSKLVGQIEYEDITIQTILDKVQKTKFDTFKKTWQANASGLTATHIIGGVTTHLTGVRYGGSTFGEFDKLSNSASKLTITITYEGIRNA